MVWRLNPNPRPQHDAERIRVTLWTIVVVAGGLAGAEAWLASKAQPSLGLWLLSGGTGAFTLSLLPPLRMVRRGELGRAVVMSCISILCIQALYLTTYPAAYAAITIASFVVVALGLSFVSGPRLLRLVVASGTIAAISVIWGNLGSPVVDVPRSAAATILIGSGVAAVIVGMVLLWQFARNMTHALDDAHLAHDELSVAHEKLRSLDLMKGQFINTAAHELNTPLTPVLLQLSLLKNGKRGPVDHDQERSLQVMERNLMRISGLVKEMLDVARMQAGRLATRPERFALGSVLREGFEDYVGVARSREVRLTLTPGDDLQVLADRRHTAQVISNLLSNAVRLTPANGSIQLSTRKEPGKAIVVVADSGIGLSEAQLESLFQPFTRIHDETPGTTGLGLFICRGLIHDMGGAVWAESAGPGKGATFSFSLPLAETA